MRDWRTYIDKTRGKEPSRLMIEALSLVKDTGRALDLGAGAMSDTRYMQKHGFRQIDVVDIEPQVAVIAPTGVNTYILAYERFAFPEDTYNFVNAQHALPFAGEKTLDGVMKKVKKTLKCGGVFAGTFFGPMSDWASDPDIAVVTREWVNEFFNPIEWDIYKIEEEEAIRPTASGHQKRWHIFSVIAARNC